MNGPLFTNPALLGGLAVLAVPILIHLLLRTKKRRQRFSTLQFFQRHDEQATRRRRLRNWLLLAARVLLLLLIVAAFARPYLISGPAAANGTLRQQLILLVDRSASMNANDREGVRWERAKMMIRKRLARLGPEDRVALVSCATRSEVLVEPAPPADLLKSMDTLKATHGPTDLGKGLQQAARLLTNASSLYTNTICIVSDLQHASCANLGSYSIPDETGFEVLNIGDMSAPNVALTELALTTREAEKPCATVVNFSEEEFSNFALELLVDGRAISSVPLTLAGGTSKKVELALPAMEPGWHSAEVRIQPGDAQPLDDVCYRTFYTPRAVQVLVVEPRQATKVFQEETFFIASALDPSFGLTNAGHRAFSLEKITPDNLLARMQRHNSPSPYDVVVLPGVKSITPGVAESLKKFVSEGGGLLLFLNDSLSLNRYNTELAQLLPAQLEKLETATDLDWRLWEHDHQSAIFAAFKAPSSGNLALAVFNRRAALRLLGNASVVARFQDGAPLMMERGVGKGRVLMVNTSADTAWSDWPKRRTYVPWIHGATRFLANRKPATDTGATDGLMTGTETEVELGPEYKSATLKLHGPDGSEMSCATDAEGWLQNVDFSTAGVYSLRTAAGVELRRWGVNIPPEESDLAAMSPREFERRVPRSDAPRQFSTAAALFGSREGRHELWPLLLCGGLVLLLLESVLANRTLA